MLNKIYRFFVGYRNRYNYWSNSKFSVAIQKMAGMEKDPVGATAKEWRNIETKKKETNKVIWWITEEGFDIAQNVCYFPFDVYRNVKRYVVNRFVDKTHIIDTKLEKGQWHEVQDVLLHGIMETVVDFVEGQKAHMQDIAAKLNEDKDNPIPHIKNRREAGLAYLDWEIELGEENPYQSECAAVVKEVYLWWKDKYPNRPDPYDISGWSDYCDSKEHLLEPEEDEEKRTEVRALLDNLHNIEELYDLEDQAMMEKVIKYRKGMWT